MPDAVVNSLMRQLAEVWDWVRYRDGRLEYFGACDPSGYVRVIQGTYTDLSREHPKMLVHMQDSLLARDFGGFGPPIVVELAGDGEEWHCRRVVCPESDGALVTQEGIGKTRTEATAKALVALLQPGSPAPSKSPDLSAAKRSPISESSRVEEAQP